MKDRYYVLCPARHELGELEAKIDGAIFPSVIESPMDFNGLEAIAQKYLVYRLALLCAIIKI